MTDTPAAAPPPEADDDDQLLADDVSRRLLAILDQYADPDPATLSKLPKPKQRDAEKGRCDADAVRRGVSDYACGGWHGLPALHLDYMGHADVTEALIRIDPQWSWRPAAINPNTGGPQITQGVGTGKLIAMWAYLTVLGVERLCVGTCEASKQEAEKELIGDMLRNGALRFGIAVRLWSKADHADTAGDDSPAATVQPELVAAGGAAAAVRRACGGNRDAGSDWWHTAERGDGPWPRPVVDQWVAEASAWWLAHQADYQPLTAADAEADAGDQQQLATV